MARLILLAVLLTGCTHRVIQHQGIPRDAAASTWCDGTDGTVRSALDANLFRVLPDGTVSSVPALAEILVHEAVHREQLEARRHDGICHKVLTWTALLAMEVEAYCAGFAMALQLGRNPVEVGQRYAQALAHQFRSLNDWALIAHVWQYGCPQYALVWEP